LRMLNRAASLNDLRLPPTNRLEKLKEDRTGHYSIRINDQWRICFEWQDGDAYDVEIADYHWGNLMMAEEMLSPVQPGEILLEEFLKPMGLSQNQLALALRVPARRSNELVHGRRRITADTALRLAKYFNMSPQFWLGLQMDYDLDLAEDTLGEQINDVLVYAGNKPAT
jgi:addiction module HigA family antidote